MVMSLSESSQRLEPGAFICLYTLDCSSLGGGIFRWSNCCEDDGSHIRFGGLEYPPINFKAEGFAWSDGKFPRPRLRASVGDSEGQIPQRLLDMIFGYNGGQGAILYRVRTLDRYLDGHEDGGQSIAYPSDMFMVDSVAVNKQEAVWELIAPMELPNLRLPSRQILRDSCPWVYRRWNAEKNKFDYDQTDMACPYTGAPCFDKNGETCGNADDECGRRLSDCVKRFGKGKPLYYGGFPGVARTRV